MPTLLAKTRRWCHFAAQIKTPLPPGRSEHKSLRIENPGNTSISASVDTLGHSAAFADNVTLKIHIYREQIEIGNGL